MHQAEPLASVVRDLSYARELGSVTAIVRAAARELVGADGVSFVLRDGDQCHYVDEEAIAPLWKGRRFPLRGCISGWVMQHREAVAIPDVYADARIPHDTYRPTFVKSLAMVPVRTDNPIAAIGAYWARPHAASKRELAMLQLVADASAAAIAGIEAMERLERRSAELHSAVEQLHIVTDTMSAPVMRCSRDLRYLWVSRPYADWLGRPVDEIVGRPIEDVLGTAAFSQLRPQFDRVLAGERVEYEERVDFAGLGPRWVHVAYAPTFDSAGGVDGWVAVVEDVEERKRAEQAVLDETARKDEFLALLGHELRNPLAPIRSAAELLRLRSPKDPELDRAHAVIDRQLRHLGRLVDDLLDLSRLRTGRVELRRAPVDLRDAVTQAVEACEPLAREKKQALAVRLPAEPVVVDGDTDRLCQVLSNLLHNAIRYTSRGGHVRVTLAVEGPLAVLQVQDDGIGIASSLLPSIFDMFTRSAPASRSDGGLGIGLTLARRLVELHGGSISAHSRGPGLGSEFVARLPTLAGVAVEPPASRAALHGPRQGEAPAPALRVAVVDDHVDSAESLAMLLRNWGHEVAVAHGGREAVALVTARCPDVVLLDIGMPGMDGYEAARRIRELPGAERLTLVALTGFGLPADRERTAAAGFQAHFTKPADPRALKRLLAGVAVAPGRTG